MSAPIRTPIASNTPSVPEPRNETSAPSTNATPVVRTLKPPPEIWELVHPVPTKQFKPGRTFVTRLSSGWTNLVLLAVAVGVVSGVCTTIWRLRSNQNTSGAEPIQHTPAKQPVALNVGSGTTEAPNTSPAAAVDTSVIQPTDVSVNEEVGGTPSPARKRPSKRSVRVAAEPQQSATAESASTQPSASINQADTKNSPDSAALKPKSNSTLSPQLIAPVKTSPDRKAKVIQWP